MQTERNEKTNSLFSCPPDPNYLLVSKDTFWEEMSRVR